MDQQFKTKQLHMPQKKLMIIIILLMKGLKENPHLRMDLEEGCRRS